MDNIYKSYNILIYMDEKEIAKKYADIKGFKLNPDEKELNLVLDGLAKNREKYKVPYCPCRSLTGNQDKDKEIICPCVFHRGEIELQGCCLCKLFWSK